MVCKKCGKELKKDAIFCGGCGLKVEDTITCRSCGTENPKGFTFCCKCGKKINTEPKRNSKKIVLIICGIIAAFFIFFLIIYPVVIFPPKTYDQAVALMNQGQTEEALEKFYQISNYKDSSAKIFKLDKFSQIDTDGHDSIIGLSKDGKVVWLKRYLSLSLEEYIPDYHYGFSGWKNIVSVSAGREHAVGLKSDGTEVC